VNRPRSGALRSAHQYDSGMASRVCWNCEKDANQTLVGSPVRERGEFGDSSVWTGFYTCDSCGHGSLGEVQVVHREVLISSYKAQPRITTAMLDTAALANLFNSPQAEVRWLPEHVHGRRFDDVPNPIADAASEAYACYSIRSYRAAILLARSVVEAVAKDKGITTGNLSQKIDKLADADHIRPLIKESAHEIRHLGNGMAHGDFIEPTEEDDALDVLEFMSAVLTEVYQLPAQVNARRSTREKRKAAAKERRMETDTPS
jgi:hypothetical protein